MKVISSIDFSILNDGKYRLDREIVYTSPRYGKIVTVPTGYVSDGATGAMDIASQGWWIHDVLCERGTWDDGVKLSNWQCSTVLYDILKAEGRTLQAGRWRIATWLFGGGEARKNGMFKVAAAMLALSIFPGCAVIDVQINGDSNQVSIEQPKTVTTTPTVSADLTTGDNAIPIK